MKILLVEDEIKVASFLRKGLEEQKHQIDQAYDGEMGKRLAVENDYDLIVLDVILPKADGIEVCKHSR